MAFWDGLAVGLSIAWSLVKCDYEIILFYQRESVLYMGLLNVCFVIVWEVHESHGQHLAEGPAVREHYQLIERARELKI